MTHHDWGRPAPWKGNTLYPPISVANNATSRYFPLAKPKRRVVVMFREMHRLRKLWKIRLVELVDGKLVITGRLPRVNHWEP